MASSPALLESAATELSDCASILQGVLEATEGSVFSLDTACRYTAFNRRHAAIMKAIYGRDIRLGDCLLDHMTVPEDRFTARANLDRVLKGERVVAEAYSGETGLDRRYFEVSHIPLYGAQGACVGILVFSRDVTARKAADDRLALEHRNAAYALECSQARFHLLSKNLPSMVYQILRTAAGDQRFTFLGPQVEHLHGVRAEEALENPELIYGQLAAEDRRRVQEAEARAAKDMSVFSFEARMRLPDGRERWRYFVSAPRPQPNGDVLWDGMELDISQQKELEASLKKARDEAEAASRAKSAFLATVSHEVRTPLNGILGFTDLALGTSLSQDQRYYLGIVKRRSEDLLAILNDILDMTRLEANRMVLQTTPFDARQLLAEVSRLFSIELDRKGLSFAARVEGDLPATLFGDALRLKQVLVNLVGNAVKFTARGHVRVTLAREPAAPADGGRIRVRFLVADTGIGVPADKLEAIFEPFVQADASSTRPYGGNGLGLTIARRLAGQMGGAVWCESEPGRGSRFFFTALLDPLPPGRPSADAGAAAEAPAPARAAARRLLVVDDDPASLILERRLLEREGHEVTLAEDGQAALRALAAGDFDAVLLDVLMPGLDGLEVARSIRSQRVPVRNPAIPLIAVTANAMKGDDQACLAAGMNAYLPKPISAEGLRAALAGVLAPAVPGGVR